MIRGRISQSKSIPAPRKGWDAKNSIANMDPEAAVELINWFPTTADILMRKGYSSYVTGLPDQVETLMAYEKQSGSDELYGGSSAGIYNVSSAGAVGSAVVSSQTNVRYQHVNVTDSGGTHYLIAVNGADLANYYNGTSWAAVNDVSSPAITGVTTSDLINVTVHKKFVWFVEKDSMSLWYLPTGAVGGAATEFPMDTVFKKGGYLVDIDTWTLDAGDGVDDYFAMVTSEGEIAIYQGTSPASASTWALVGVWALAQPIGDRVFMKYGGDLLAILEDGIQPLSAALLSSTVNRQTALTDNIRSAMTDAATSYSNNFGWQMLHYPRANMLILNVPVAEGSSQEQYVMNTITRAWCRFQDIEANCWSLFNNEPYFGGDEVVYRFWDDFEDNGSNINSDALQAFDYFGERGQQKRWTMARPVFQAAGTPAISMGINVDYDTTDNTTDVPFTATTAGTWDSATWDNGIWGGGLSSFLNWVGIGGVGFAAAARVTSNQRGVETRWVSTDFIYEVSGKPI